MSSSAGRPDRTTPDDCVTTSGVSGPGLTTIATAALSSWSDATGRNKSPFYDIVLGFAIYRSHLAVFESLTPVLAPGKAENREDLLQTGSGQGLSLYRPECRHAVVEYSQPLQERRFIRIVMEAVAQGAPRWALYDPDNVLHIEKLELARPMPLSYCS